MVNRRYARRRESGQDHSDLERDSAKCKSVATLLGMDYRTIRHHLGVLEKNRIITSAGEGYGITYFLSPVMEENYGLFEEIVKKIWKK